MTQIQFNLYLNISLWTAVNITDALREYYYEIVTQTTGDFMWLCLEDIGKGTPFISALELRPVKDSLYPDTYYGKSSAILFRLNYGPTRDVVIR
jgi:Malectin-like domain